MHTKDKSLDFMDIFYKHQRLHAYFDRGISYFEAGRAYKLSAYKANPSNGRWLGFRGFRLIFVPMTVRLKTAVRRIDLLFLPRKKLRSNKTDAYL